MKKIIRLIICLSLLFFISGCGNSSQNKLEIKSDYKNIVINSYVKDGVPISELNFLGKNLEDYTSQKISDGAVIYEKKEDSKIYLYMLDISSYSKMKVLVKELDFKTGLIQTKDLKGFSLKSSNDEKIAQYDGTVKFIKRIDGNTFIGGKNLYVLDKEYNLIKSISTNSPLEDKTLSISNVFKTKDEYLVLYEFLGGRKGKYYLEKMDNNFNVKSSKLLNIDLPILKDSIFINEKIYLYNDDRTNMFSIDPISYTITNIGVEYGDILGLCRMENNRYAVYMKDNKQNESISVYSADNNKEIFNLKLKKYEQKILDKSKLIFDDGNLILFRGLNLTMIDKSNHVFDKNLNKIKDVEKMEYQSFIDLSN